MTSLTEPTHVVPVTPAAERAHTSHLGQTLRLLVLTAWLAVAVPLVGVLEIAWVRSHNPDLHPADPAVGSAFLGGAAVGLAIWTLAMLLTLRGNAHRLHVDQTTIWWLLAPWVPAGATWLLFRGVITSGGAAGCSVVVLLAGWFMVWRSAHRPLQ